MKRSEMLEIIRKQLSQVLIGSVQNDAAEWILRAQEKAGMEPPLTTKIISGIVCQVAEWDPEK